SSDALQWPRDEAVSRAHFHIGEWYERAFLVSGHAGTLVESAFHYFRAGVTAPKYARSNGQGRKNEFIAALRWLVAVNQLIRIMRIGRSSVRFWMEHAHRLDWFGLSATSVVHEALEASRDAVYVPQSFASDWTTLTDGLLAMLKAEFLILGSESQPAARIFGSTAVTGPTSVPYESRSALFANVLLLLGVEGER